MHNSTVNDAGARGTAVDLEVGPDGVAVITLNGPATLNAFSGFTGDDLGKAFRRCDSDDTVRAVVLTGAGRAFCSGADVSPGSDPFASPGAGFSASPVEPPAWRVRKLVIAAVNGHAIGIGFTLALQCDLLIVAEEAKLAVPQVRRGMLGDASSHWTVRRAAGAALAADLLLTGRTITGTEAASRGLAVEALPAAEVLPAALARAREVAEQAAPASVALSKALLWSDLGSEAVAEAETWAHLMLMNHPDALEGPRAWRERRPPRWTLPVSQLPTPPWEARADRAEKSADPPSH